MTCGYCFRSIPSFTPATTNPIYLSAIMTIGFSMRAATRVISITETRWYNSPARFGKAVIPKFLICRRVNLKGYFVLLSFIVPHFSCSSFVISMHEAYLSSEHCTRIADCLQKVMQSHCQTVVHFLNGRHWYRRCWWELLLVYILKDTFADGQF